MVLAIRSLKTEDGSIVSDFLKKVIEDGGGGISYAVADRSGMIVASGIAPGAELSSLGNARLRAVAAVIFQKNTVDMNNATTGNSKVDDIYSGGGVTVVINGEIYGAIGIAGRPKPEKLFPGKPLWDHEIAFQAAEHLVGKIHP